MPLMRAEAEAAVLRPSRRVPAARVVRTAGPLPPLAPRRMLELQSAAGNRALAALVGQHPVVQPVVQRCGGEPCGCPPEEQQQAAAPPAAVQRVRQDPATGRKLFDCSVFVGETVLEACLNDEARLAPPARGAPVGKVQNALLKDGQDLGPRGADGVYGPMTARAVKAFKSKYSLGFEQFGDVGPGTMDKLDTLCLGRENPPPEPLPDELIVKGAKSDRDSALRTAGNKLRELVAIIDSGVVPVTGNATATAVATWLLVPTDSPAFPDTVRRALRIVDANALVQTTITVDRTQTRDFAHVGAIGVPSSGIVIEDPFFRSNVRCQHEVMAHEFFHLSGLVHAYGTKDPAEAINCPHHLAELVFDLATGETEGCSRPPLDDLRPLP